MHLRKHAVELVITGTTIDYISSSRRVNRVSHVNPNSGGGLAHDASAVIKCTASLMSSIAIAIICVNEP